MASSKSREIDPAEEFPVFLSKDYELVRKLANCSTAIIYQAVSTRGRLRGRHIALKKVTHSETTAPSSSLHQALCHPNIVALHSVISSDSENLHYEVLQFCPEGNLHHLLHSRNPPTLTDTELPHITKGIASALIYLKDEGIIHGNLGLSNILLGQGLQPKLCDFKHAILYQASQTSLSHPFKLAIHPAPELLKIPPRYDFSIDAWALGCILHACMGETTIETFNINTEGSYPTFFNHPHDLCDLVSSLLVPCSNKRLKVEDIPKHSYLLDSSTTKLHSALGPRQEKGIIDKHLSSQPKAPSAELSISDLLNNRTMPIKGNDESTPMVYSTNHLKKRRVLKDIGNVPLPRFLRSKWPSESGTNPSCGSTTFNPEPILAQNSEPHRPLDDHKMETNSVGCTLQPRAPTIAIPTHQITTPDLPIGTTRPQPIDSSSLSPKTHKLAAGTIAILKSRSLLVDFRQSQRRQGLRGDQVMLISAQGTSVMVYDAPHLSVPSCLLEPTHRYDLQDLPSSYWKEYNDAASFIDRLKRRIPRVVIYESEAKFALMSNSPLADIEIILYGEDSSTTSGQNRGTQSKGQTPVMRIQYSRRRHFLELAQKLTGDRGTEWKKECKPCLSSNDISILLLGDQSSGLERKGLKLLLDLLKTCQQLEASETVDLNRTSLTKPISFTGPPLAIHWHDHLEETRYLPSVGWCKRYSGFDSFNNFKYMLMFFDGTSLLVDLTENSVLFSPPHGNQITCTLSQPELAQRHPEVHKYARFIVEFVSLYDFNEKTKITEALGFKNAR